MISVLIPSRGRPEQLRKSLDSLYDNLSAGAELQVIVRVDLDDEILRDSMVHFINATLYLGPRLGYARMHDYYNELAYYARGEHFLIWNDDTEMLTKDWDALLLSDKTKANKVQFIRRDTKEKADDTFPLVPRWVFEAMGHFSLHCYVDTWLSAVAAMSDIRVFRNDVVFHHHRLGDDTSAGQAEALKTEHDRFHVLGAQQAADAVKVTAAWAQLKTA